MQYAGGHEKKNRKKSVERVKTQTKSYFVDANEINDIIVDIFRMSRNNLYGSPLIIECCWLVILMKGNIFYAQFAE